MIQFNLLNFVAMILLEINNKIVEDTLTVKIKNSLAGYKLSKTFVSESVLKFLSVFVIEINQTP